MERLTINIIGGSGEMGQTHKKVFEQAGFKVIISGRNSSPSIEEATKMSDVTIISVPIDATQETIKKVAPYAKALMDFTSVKVNPVKWMIEYSNPDCEVCGLHPLYAGCDSIKGKTIIACSTEKTGEKCKSVIESLEKAGATIKEMRAEEHDLIVNGLAQDFRTFMLQSYATLAEKINISLEELYQISPPPTKILLDLLARQVNPKNDSMYEEMRKNNPFFDFLLEESIKLNKNKSLTSPEKIRKSFGNQLEKSQEKAKKYIEEN